VSSRATPPPPLLFLHLQERSSCLAARRPGTQPFGALLGVTHGGVGAYSCDYASFEEGLLTTASLESVVDGVFTGCKFQCVEFARRYLLVNAGAVFAGVDNAFEIMNLTSVRRITDDAELPLLASANGAAPRPPAVGSLLIWAPGDVIGSAGHVAVVVAAALTHIDIAEQNWEDVAWPPGQNYSRRLQVKAWPRHRGRGGVFVEDSIAGSVILGWVTVDGFEQPAASIDSEDGGGREASFLLPSPTLDGVEGASTVSSNSGLGLPTEARWQAGEAAAQQQPEEGDGAPQDGEEEEV
jgi:hypothetical protein